MVSTDNILVQFIVLVLGCTSIGAWWIGWIGGLLGFVLGIYLFWQLRKRSRVDYNRIEKMFNERLGPPRK